MGQLLFPFFPLFQILVQFPPTALYFTSKLGGGRRKEEGGEGQMDREREGSVHPVIVNGLWEGANELPKV